MVEEVFVREGRLFELTAHGRTLRTTPEHPFFVREKGWTPAGELQPGDQLSTATGEWLELQEIADTGQSVTVYNFRVSEYHTYFIAPGDLAFDVWVHNTYTLSQQRQLAHLTRDVREELVNDFDALARELTPNEIRAIASDPWRMQLFFGTALEGRVATRVDDFVAANPNSNLADLVWTGRTNAPQDFIGPNQFGFEITGNSVSSIRSHFARPEVDAVITYDSIPSDLGYRFIRWFDTQ